MIIGLLQNFIFTLQISLCRVWYAAIKCCTSSATNGRFTTCRDVAAAPQTPQLGGGQANFGGPS